MHALEFEDTPQNRQILGSVVVGIAIEAFVIGFAGGLLLGGVRRARQAGR